MPDSRILQHPYFNPRSREGSDIPVARSSVPDDTISIHAPARGATVKSLKEEGLKLHFNPRSREGSDTTSWQNRFTVFLFQSTLPRGERQRTSPGLHQRSFISIHAPARGATTRAAKPRAAMPISIHAPARGATEVKNGNFQTMSDFNPRSREGSDAARKMTAYEGL